MQLLLPNDRFCVCNPRVNATLQLQSEMSILGYLKPVTGNTFQLIMKQDCLPASPRRWTSQWKEQLPVIAMRRTMEQKANTIGKYAAGNGNAAALGDSMPCITLEKAPCDYSRSATGSVQESCGGCGQT